MRPDSAISRTLSIIIAVVVIAAAGGLYFFVTQPAPTPAPQFITLGASLPMTGLLEAFGKEQNLTLTYVVTDINEMGGIPVQTFGKSIPVKLIVLDDASDPTKAFSNLQLLATQHKVDVIIGELGGVQDSVAASFSAQFQVPYVGPVFLSDAKKGTNSWLFSPFQNETDEANIFLGWYATVADPKQTRIAFYGETGDPVADASERGFTQVATRLGYTIAFKWRGVPVSSEDMQSFILRAKSEGVDAVYGLPIPPDAINMIAAAKALDFSPKAWLLTRGTAVPPFGLVLGKDSDFVLSAFVWHPAVPYIGDLLGKQVSSKSLAERYTKDTGQPPFLAGVYYTAGLVAATAIKNAGSLDKAEIRKALAELSVNTPMGPMSFTPGGQWTESANRIMIFQWRNGKLEIVWPTSLATESMVYPFPPWKQR